MMDDKHPACFGIFGFSSGFGRPCFECRFAPKCSDTTDLLTGVVGNKEAHLMNYFENVLSGEKMAGVLAYRANQNFIKAWGGETDNAQ